MSVLSEIVELEKKYQKLLGKYRKVSKSEIPTDVLEEAKILNKKIHQLMKENGVSQEDVIKAYKEDAKKATEIKTQTQNETVVEAKNVVSSKDIETNEVTKNVTAKIEIEETIPKATKTKSTTKKALNPELATIETEIEKPKAKRTTKTKKAEEEKSANIERAESDVVEKPKTKRTTKTKKTVEPEIISNVELIETEEKPKAKRTSKAKSTTEVEKALNIELISNEDEIEKTVKKSTKKSSTTAKATTTRKKATKKQLQDEETDIKLNIKEYEENTEPVQNVTEVIDNEIQEETIKTSPIKEKNISNIQKYEVDLEENEAVESISNNLNTQVKEIKIDIEKLEEELLQDTENTIVDDEKLINVDTFEENEKRDEITNSVVDSENQAVLRVKQMMEEAEKKIQAEKIEKANEEMKKALEKAKAEIVKAEQDVGEVQVVENIVNVEKEELSENKKALPVVVKKKGIFAKIYNWIAKIKFIRINRAISKAALQYSDLSGLEKYVYVTTGSLDKFLKEINKGNKEAVEALGEIFFNEIDNNIEDGIRTDFLKREEKYENKLNDKKGKRAAKNIEEKAYETFEQSFIKAIDLYDFLSPEEKVAYATQPHFDNILKSVKEELELIDIKKMIYTFTKLKNTASMRKTTEQQ